MILLLLLLLVTPEVGLVGGRYPYPIMYMTQKMCQSPPPPAERLFQAWRNLDFRPFTNPGSATACIPYVGIADSRYTVS